MSHYIVLEGGDGCGKSTQASRLVTWLEERTGGEVLHVREPGSTPLAEALRSLLLAQREDGTDIEPLVESLLFSAARRELVHDVIAPALARGVTVVSERSFVSTMVYQCLAPLAAAERVSLEFVARLTAEVHAGTWPSLVAVLDVPVAVGRARMGGRRDLDRIESRGAEYAESVRAGFRDLRGQPALRGIVPTDAWQVVDAAASSDQVLAELQAHVEALLRADAANADARGAP